MIQLLKRCSVPWTQSAKDPDQMRAIIEQYRIVLLATVPSQLQVTCLYLCMAVAIDARPPILIGQDLAGQHLSVLADAHDT